MLKVHKFAVVLGIAATALVANRASAAGTSGSGQVALIANYASNLTGYSNYIIVGGFAATGTTCLLSSGNAFLALRLDDNGKQQAALAMSAMLAGRTVGIGVDDSDKDASGKCYLRWITLN